MSFDRFQQEREDRAALLRARGDGHPDVLASSAAGFTVRALGDAAVDHHEADRLLGQVVGRLDAGGGDELEVGFAVFLEPHGQVLGVLALRHPRGRHANDLDAGRSKLPRQARLTKGECTK